MRHWRSRRRFLAVLSAVITSLATGCVTQDEISGAIGDVNREFRQDYEAILAKKGTRSYNVNRGAAFDAARSALTRLGMTIETQDPGLGYINVVAPG